MNQRLLSASMRQRLLQDFRSARRRLVLSDYDGTLTPLKPTPEQALPDPELLALIGQLTQTADVVIVSGRPRVVLDSWFVQLALSLVAEHGAWIKERGQDWVNPQPLPTEWKPKVRDLMALSVDGLPNAFVEEKEFTLAWHYRLADPDLGPLRARELADQLRSLTESSDLKVVEGNKVIEVQPSGFGKGQACQGFLARGYDFVLALGDDTTDEDLFRALPAPHPDGGGTWSIRVGQVHSHARFNVSNQEQVRELLEALASLTG